MARIGGFTERRQLRRSADQALMDVFPQPADEPDVSPADSEPQSEGSVVNGETDSEAFWRDPDDTPPLGMPLPVIARIDLATPRGRWSRSTRVILAVIALAVVAIAVSTVLLFSGGTESGPGQPKVDSTSTTSAPAPTSATPAPPAATVPSEPPPAPPPPPPPPDEPANTAGAAAPQYPQYPRYPRQTDSGPEQRMPQIDVTRTPFSAKPPPPHAPQYNQGDGRRGPFGW